MASVGICKPGKDDQSFLNEYKGDIKNNCYSSAEESIKSIMDSSALSGNSSIGFYSNAFAQIDSFYALREVDDMTDDDEQTKEVEQDIRLLEEKLRLLSGEQRKKIRPIVSDMLSEIYDTLLQI